MAVWMRAALSSVIPAKGNCHPELKAQIISAGTVNAKTKPNERNQLLALIPITAPAPTPTSTAIIKFISPPNPSLAWGPTSDGVGGLTDLVIAVLGGVGAGAVMGISAKSWFRSSGFVYAVTVPALMIWAFNSGWQLPFAGITEDRAARIQTAIENFYSRAGRYPSTLNELVPRELLYVPQPVMFHGEGWCYQGGADYYRFGPFYHEYFSTTVSL